MRTLYDIRHTILGVGIGIIILWLKSINRRFKAEYLEGRRDGFRDGLKRGRAMNSQDMLDSSRIDTAPEDTERIDQGPGNDSIRMPNDREGGVNNDPRH